MLAHRPIFLGTSNGGSHALWRMPGRLQWRMFTSEAAGQGSVSYLRNSQTGAEIYLVGTAHVSAKSAEQVLKVINEVKPSTIALEHCAEGATELMAGQENETQNFFRTIAQFLQTPGGLRQKFLTFAIESFYGMLRNDGLELGKEFEVACEEAKNHGAKLVYIDQDIEVTMENLVDALTLRDIFRMLTNPSYLPSSLRKGMFEAGELEEEVERLTTRKDVRAMMGAMEKLFPKVVQVMVHDRDKLMVSKLRECQGKVVGVVGMAHMDGIERHWMESENLSSCGHQSEPSI